MHKVSDLIKLLELELIAGEGGLDNTISGVYIGDLLSWVMAHLQAGNIWITIQTHVNILAVALLADASCIIIPEYAEIDSQTVEKANHEGIPLLRSKHSAYQLAIRIKEHDLIK